MNVFRKCILHIGGEKTGTTTLQAFLNQNRAGLLSQGFFVPRSLGSHEHILLALYAMDADRRNGPRRRRGHNTVEKIESFRGTLAKQFRREISNALKGTTLIISCERLHTQVTRANELLRVKELLEPICDDFGVVLYMRPQHELAVSLYTTMLLNGDSPQSLLPENPLSMGSFDYEGSLDRWSSLLGPQSIHPRIFSKETLHNQDVCDDFCILAGIDINKLERMPRKNESLSADAQIFLKHFNNNVPVYEGDITNPDRGDFGRLLKETFVGGGLLPSKAEAQHFYSKFNDTNERIRARWFPRRETLFETNFEKFPVKSEELRELDMDKAFEIFAAIWSAKHKLHELAISSIPKPAPGNRIPSRNKNDAPKSTPKKAAPWRLLRRWWTQIRRRFGRLDSRKLL